MDQEPTLRQKIGALLEANPKMKSAIEEFLGGAPIAGEQANRYPKRGNDA